MRSEVERRARENLLRMHAAQSDSALADFAKEVLAGRSELRDLAHSSAATEEVLAGVAPMLDAWRNASDAEREQAVADAPEAMARINAALADLDQETLVPQRASDTDASTVDDEDDWSEWTLHDHSR